MSIFQLSKNYRIARRLREIVNVFLRHGFGNLIDQLYKKVSRPKIITPTDNEAANSGRAKLMMDMFTSQLETSLQARTTLDNEGAGMPSGTDPGVV